LPRVEADGVQGGDDLVQVAGEVQGEAIQTSQDTDPLHDMQGAAGWRTRRSTKKQPWMAMKDNSRGTARLKQMHAPAIWTGRRGR
jgi:hypothetical protein